MELRVAKMARYKHSEMVSAYSSDQQKKQLGMQKRHIAAVEKAEHDADHTWKRKAEYPSTDELIVALWEGVVEERMAAVTKLEGKRQAVKTKYPK